MGKNKIFDLEDLKDLPDSVKTILNVHSLGMESTFLLNLFKIKKQLSINEIIVGLYRNHGLIKTRSWVSSTLYNLHRKNLVEKIGNKRTDCYQLVKK
jgi:hypothetical protein